MCLERVREVRRGMPGACKVAEGEAVWPRGRGAVHDRARGVRGFGDMGRGGGWD